MNRKSLLTFTHDLEEFELAKEELKKLEEANK